MGVIIVIATVTIITSTTKYCCVFSLCSTIMILISMIITIMITTRMRIMVISIIMMTLTTVMMIMITTMILTVLLRVITTAIDAVDDGNPDSGDKHDNASINNKYSYVDN